MIRRIADRAYGRFYSVYEYFARGYSGVRLAFDALHEQGDATNRQNTEAQEDRNERIAA